MHIYLLSDRLQMGRAHTRMNSAQVVNRQLLGNISPMMGDPRQPMHQIVRTTNIHTPVSSLIPIAHPHQTLIIRLYSPLWPTHCSLRETNFNRTWLHLRTPCVAVST